MTTEVVMPQMGESIAEGTITKWFKKVGDRVERDEPLFEISTDKVDAEIPSPAAGVLTEIKFKEGDTVEVNKVIAVLDGEGTATSASPASATDEKPVAKPDSDASAEEAFEWLDAPVIRLASIDTPVPHSPPLEDYYLPQTKDVVDAARKLAAY